MRLSTASILGALTAFAVLMAAPSARSATFTALPGYGDADFVAAVNSGAFVEDFVAEARSGNNGLSGDRELGLNEVNPGGIGGATNNVPGQYIWTSGQAVDFALGFNAATGALTYTMGSSTLGATGAGIVTLTRSDVFDTPTVPEINTILLRARADSENGGSSFGFTNLVLDGMAGLDLLATASASDQVTYLMITDFDSDFVITGTQTMTWANPGANPPSGSKLAAQFKFGYVADVPLPPSLAFLLLALGSVIWIGRRRRS